MPTVDPVRLLQEKRRIVRQMHQNVRDEQISGLAKKELLICLGLWDDKEKEGDRDDGSREECVPEVHVGPEEQP